jgi:hypothetical protein
MLRGLSARNRFFVAGNAAMWLVPVFIVVFAVITYFLVHGASEQAESPIAINWHFYILSP